MRDEFPIRSLGRNRQGNPGGGVFRILFAENEEVVHDGLIAFHEPCLRVQQLRRGQLGQLGNPLSTFLEIAGQKFLPAPLRSSSSGIF